MRCNLTKRVVSNRKTEKLKERGKKYMVQAKKLREKTKRLKGTLYIV